MAQPLEPVRVTGTVKPVGITEPAKGVYIVDMGQNFEGLASFKFDLEKGTQVKMRYGELLHEDGTLNPMTSVCGQIKGKPNDSFESPLVDHPEFGKPIEWNGKCAKRLPKMKVSVHCAHKRKLRFQSYGWRR